MTESPLSAADLLAAPRGRQLCDALRPWPRSAGAGDQPRGVVDRLARRPDQAVPDLVALFDGLVRVVSRADYWQTPDAADARLADPEILDELWPAAEAICASPAARWWSMPVDLDDQYEIARGDSSTEFQQPPVTDGHDALVAWRAQTVEHERELRAQPAGPDVMVTGVWWSTPAHSRRLLRSTRRLPRHGPVGLYLVEDSLGWNWARCWPVLPSRRSSVFEIHRPGDWSELVTRYPLAVTNGRRHDWRRVTGRDLPWAIPDYLAVTEDYDAIHLSLAGYLSTAGRALPAGDAYTVLAGWSPDETWWLTDRPPRSGEGVRWGRGVGHELAAWSPS